MLTLPTCKHCGSAIVPLSDDNQPYAMWVCSGPDCGYAIGKSLMESVYFKGMAAGEPRQKGLKQYVEYRF